MGLGTKSEPPARSTINNSLLLLLRSERNSRWPWMLLRPRFLVMVALSFRALKPKLSASTTTNLSIREYTLMVDQAQLAEQEASPIFLNFVIAPQLMSAAYKDEAQVLR